MLNTLDGWITGLRRDQTTNRTNVTMFQLDHGHGGILKINPIIDWTWDQIQEYIKNNNLPYNSLLDKGFLKALAVSHVLVQLNLEKIYEQEDGGGNRKEIKSVAFI
jgi:3'-phosphoadenosine 5'-phosphosulfate sulfotransferase (PAPS reductase)/FAD synthetase